MTCCKPARFLSTLQATVMTVKQAHDSEPQHKYTWLCPYLVHCCLDTWVRVNVRHQCL